MQKTRLLMSVSIVALLASASQAGAQQIGISIAQAQGSEAVVVSGHGPANAAIALRLIGTLSDDVPDVSIGRYTVSTDASGNYRVTLPIAPDFARNTYITAVANAAGAEPASARLLTGAPNAGAMVPLEQQTP